MVFFLLTTLCVSLVGLVALLLVKQFELSTGKVAFARARPRVNKFFHVSLLLIERALPALVRHSIVQTGKTTRVFLQKTLAYGILSLETALQRVLRIIREKTHPERPRGEASSFLREVGEYKRTLANRTSEERAIFDE